MGRPRSNVWLLMLGMMIGVCFMGVAVTGSSHSGSSEPPPSAHNHPHPHPHPHPQPYHPNAHAGDFDAAFRRFLRDHGYTGGTVAALRDGHMVLAKGYGVTREGTEVKVGSRSPVSSLSKSLTAVAVLRLAQEGKVGLADPVFGKDGILGEVRPMEGSQADPRLRDITVGHLLRHSGGWDHSEAPLLDPVLNEMYQARGYAVPDIAKLMDAPTPLDPNTIIRYTLSQPLHYTPGTRVVYSNLGYLILGRVVERVSGLAYQDYVKRAILNPCGMWHTRLGDPASQKFGHKLDEDIPEEDTPQVERKLDEGLDIFDVLDPLTVDSTLGWFSTVFDMSRFARCVFDGEEILSDGSLELLLQRQDTAPPNDAHSWLCAGFRTNTRGAVWQDGDPHADDVILFHNLLASRNDNNDDDDDDDDDDKDNKTLMPDTWVVLLRGSHLHHLRHGTRDLMRRLGDLVKDSASVRNRFVRDLSDIDAVGVDDAVLVKFKVDEHHLDAYLSAVKQESYNVKWISPHTFPHHPRPHPHHSHRPHTAFIVISRRLVSTSEPEVNFRVRHGLGEKRLLSTKLSMERQGYNLTFLQSYLSPSHHHDQASYSFLAVFRKRAYPTDAQLKYGTDHLPEPYDKLVQMYREKRFHPLVQSVLPREGGKEERLSFVFLQTPHSKAVDFRNFYRLGEGKLERTVVQNGDAGRTLSFLDAYQLQGRTRFAAVFTNETKPRWHFQGGLTRPQSALLLESRLPDGLWPSLLVAYTDKDKEVKYAVLLRSDEDSRHAPEEEKRVKEGRQQPRRDPKSG